MIRYSVLPVVISCGAFFSLASALRAQLQSIDEAIQTSQTTGRPIFAMAGNKT